MGPHSMVPCNNAGWYHTLWYQVTHSLVPLYAKCGTKQYVPGAIQCGTTVCTMWYQTVWCPTAHVTEHSGHQLRGNQLSMGAIFWLLGGWVFDPWEAGGHRCEWAGAGAGWVLRSVRGPSLFACSSVRAVTLCVHQCEGRHSLHAAV